MLSSNNSDNRDIDHQTVMENTEVLFFLFVLDSESHVVENLQRKYEKDIFA